MLSRGLPKLRMAKFTISIHSAPMMSLRRRKRLAGSKNWIACEFDNPSGKEAKQHIR